MTYLPALGALVLGASLAQASDMPDLLETPALEANQATSAALIDLASSREGLVAVGERGVILRLIEGAWVQSPAPVGTTLTAVAFNGEGVGLAVGHDGTVLRSADAGATWEKVTDGRALFPVVIAAAQARADAAQEALDNAGEEADLEELEFALEDELFRLETAEQSLEYGPSWPFLDVKFTTPQTAWMAGAYGMLLRSDDGGQSWELVSERLENPDDFHLNALLKTAAGDLVVAGEAGMIFHSGDGGESFTRWDTDDGLSLFGLAETGETLIAYGFGDSLQISTDGGETWEGARLDENYLLIGAVALPSGGLGLVGGSGLMVEVGPDGPGAVSRPTGGRDFLSGGAVTDQGLIFVGEAGIARAED